MHGGHRSFFNRGSQPSVYGERAGDAKSSLQQPTEPASPVLCLPAKASEASLSLTFFLGLTDFSMTGCCCCCCCCCRFHGPFRCPSGCTARQQQQRQHQPGNLSHLACVGSTSYAEVPFNRSVPRLCEHLLTSSFTTMAALPGPTYSLSSGPTACRQALQPVVRPLHLGGAATGTQVESRLAWPHCCSSSSSSRLLPPAAGSST